MTSTTSKANAQGEPEAAPEAAARPAYTISEAAALCSVHRDKVKRALSGGKFPSAYRADDTAQTWMIPVTDLGAAGFRPGGPIEGGAPAAPAGTVSLGEHEAVVRERDELRTRLAVAEAVLVERDRALLLAEGAMRMIGAGEPQDAATPPQEPQERRGGFWRYLVTGDR